ncbi:NAD-dependent epimerase/dehydratase family protein [Mycolicibacterium sp. ELW1]|uniref:NAD-dependent epimerase/dehydratase family protein n=1 Tax=Mycobacteriaceae TaxID=1762 RepID=UPI0011EE96F3|nr:SDR family oxidoreductase [Mycobacterium sp. ELW1]QEN12679.1 SDR family oxidoreductase [Mycobacterium sp. ELW1]
MRIFIAGGAGYIGTVLAPRLAARGYDVTVADLAWFGNHLPPEIPVIHQDVMSISEDDLAGIDVVIFLAGLSNDPMAEFSPVLNYVHNAAAPANLAYLAKRAGVRRFVFASSCSVYGFTEDELWDEDSPTVTAHPYGISKLQAEAGVRHLQDSSFSVIILRKGTVCGYSPRMRLDLVINTMFKTALQDGNITVNNPSIWRPILSIQDATAGYIRAVEASPSVSGTFNIASENTTLGALADQIEATLRRELDLEPELRILEKADFRNYKVSVDRARVQLGFKPAYGIDRIVEDLIRHRNEFADMDNPAYYNIATFRNIMSGETAAQGHTALSPVD